MDGFLICYPYIKRYSTEPASGRKSWQPVEGHALSYYYTKDFADGSIVHIGHEYEDWALIRRIPSYRGRTCTESIINEYNAAVESIK